MRAIQRGYVRASAGEACEAPLKAGIDTVVRTKGDRAVKFEPIFVDSSAHERAIAHPVDYLHSLFRHFWGGIPERESIPSALSDSGLV